MHAYTHSCTFSHTHTLTPRTHTRLPYLFLTHVPTLTRWPTPASLAQALNRQRNVISSTAENCRESKAVLGWEIRALIGGLQVSVCLEAAGRREVAVSQGARLWAVSIITKR